MRFVGIDSVVYRVEDMDLCHRFFDDWGLRTVKRTDDEVVFETRQGPGIMLKNLHTQDVRFSEPAARLTAERGGLGRRVTTGSRPRCRGARARPAGAAR